MKPMSLALASGSFTTGPPGRPSISILIILLALMFCNLLLSLNSFHGHIFILDVLSVAASSLQWLSCIVATEIVHKV